MGRQDGAGEGVDGPDKVQVQVWVDGTGVPETPLVINIRPGSGPDTVMSMRPCRSSPHTMDSKLGTFLGVQQG